jgi:hypothetical protein
MRIQVDTTQRENKSKQSTKKIKKSGQDPMTPCKGDSKQQNDKINNNKEDLGQTKKL